MCGERGGLIIEDPIQLGASLNGVKGLDIDEEKKVVEEKMNKLRQEGATEEDIKIAMKDLGIERLAFTSIISENNNIIFIY